MIVHSSRQFKALMIDQLMIFSFKSIYTISFRPLPTSTPEPLVYLQYLVKCLSLTNHLLRKVEG
jgi:hypothetical protein